MTPSSRAARVKLPSRAAASKVASEGMDEMLRRSEVMAGFRWNDLRTWPSDGLSGRDMLEVKRQIRDRLRHFGKTRGH